MKKISLAKNFEHNVKAQLSNVDNVYVLRLYDTMFAARGIRNPADFIAYKKPNMILLECKTTAGASLPFKNISDGQWEDIYNATQKAKGILGVILIWYYDKDVTLAVDIRKLVELKNNGEKSLRFDACGDGIIKVHGAKAKLYYTYDFKSMLEEVHKWK